MREVEKIRQVGTCLLELSQQSTSYMIADKAKQDFDVLLDVLVQLNSRACDGLRMSRAASH